MNTNTHQHLFNGNQASISISKKTREDAVPSLQASRGSSGVVARIRRKSLKLRDSFTRKVSAAIAVNEGRNNILEHTAHPSDENNLSHVQNFFLGTAITADEERKNLDLTTHVANFVSKYLDKCLVTEISVLDRNKLESVKEYSKSDLTILDHLGKGSFSDVYEVSISAPIFPKKNHGIRTNNTKDEMYEIDKFIEGMGNNLGPLSSSATVQTKNNLGALSIQSINAYDAHVSRSHPTNDCNERQMNYAMKCLRPKTRSDPAKFAKCSKDLVHETAMLASLNHPNIIKLHGRAAGEDLRDAFKLNDGYFILLDKLEDTLETRMKMWQTGTISPSNVPFLDQIPIKKEESSSSPMAPLVSEQMQAILSLVSAMAYLHSKNICFRDLKPENAAFDCNGVLKLFDFGFATVMPSKIADGGETNPKLFDRCGTPCYMAPEVGLGLGYDYSADVYSFGILLWEVCSCEKAFDMYRLREELEANVYVKNKRPKLDKEWNVNMKDLISSCWDKNPSKRPGMMDVNALVEDMMNGNKPKGVKKDRNRALRRRLSWNSF